MYVILIRPMLSLFPKPCIQNRDHLFSEEREIFLYSQISGHSKKTRIFSKMWTILITAHLHHPLTAQLIEKNTAKGILVAKAALDIDRRCYSSLRFENEPYVTLILNELKLGT